MAHVGEKCRFRLIGLFGAILLLGIALGEIGELLSLALQCLLRAAQVHHSCLQAFFAVEQLFLVTLQFGDVGAD